MGNNFRHIQSVRFGWRQYDIEEGVYELDRGELEGSVPGVGGNGWKFEDGGRNDERYWQLGVIKDIGPELADIEAVQQDGSESEGGKQYG